MSYLFSDYQFLSLAEKAAEQLGQCAILQNWEGLSLIQTFFCIQKQSYLNENIYFLHFTYNTTKTEWFTCVNSDDHVEDIH